MTRKEVVTRTAVVTGSAGGIGSAVVASLENAGYRVIGVDLANADVHADLADPEKRTHAVAEVADRVGHRLDALVVCAGLGGTVSPASTIARVNYFGAVAFLDGLRDSLMAGHEPAAVAIGSNSASIAPGDHALASTLLAGDEEIAARLADQEDGQLVYAVGKLALTRWCRQGVQAWADAGVRLNVVAPGPVTTPLLQEQLDHPEYGPLVRAFPVPLNRWAEPREVAHAVRFLLSSEAAMIHGSTLFVDGGTDALVRPDVP